MPGDPSEPGAGSTVYKVKRINFLDRKAVPVFCQNYNGPCPLLAIANVLSLRNQLPDISSSITEVSTERLITMVGEKILDSQVQANVGVGASAALEAHRTATVDDCLNVLPSLATGVDVNIRFDSPTGFEFTREVSVFEMLGIDLMHGWLVDPQDTATADLLRNKTYNQAVELVVAALEADAQHVKAGSTAPTPPPPVATSPAQYEEADLLGLSESTTPTAAAAPAASRASPPTPAADPFDFLSDAPAAQPEQTTTTADGAQGEPTSDATQELQMFQGLTLSEVPTAPQLSTSDATLMTPAAATPAGAPQQAAALPDQVAAAQRTRDSLLIRLFLDNHASQLTVYGLQRMTDTMQDNTLCVFFRNNHFNCLFKHDGSLYILVTDQGYLGVPEVVWERLDTIDGDTQMCGPDFQAYKATARPEATVNMDALAAIPPGALEGLSEADAAAIAEAAGMLTPPATDAAALALSADPQHNPDADLALAMALQEEEDARERQMLAQQQQAARAQQQAPPQAAQGGWGMGGGYQQDPYVHEGYAPLQGQPPPRPQHAAPPRPPPPPEEKSTCVLM